jgi:RimJ/RimL family protein N-acetyltransferase
MVFDFAITLRDSDEMIGRCGMKRSDHEPREAMLWYVVAPEWQGQGIAAEAARAVVGYAFDELKLHRVFADCDPRNPASARVMEKVGMRREALFVENVWIKGEWCDSLVYAVLRREWPR